VAAHPDDHVADGADRDQADDRLQALLLLLGQLLPDDFEGYGDADAEPDRDRNPHPHLPHRIAAALLDQEGGDDADDQRGLDALSQGDYESRDHAGWFSLGRLGAGAIRSP
jgi:hypothetical protein